MPSLHLWDETDLHLFKATKCFIFNYLNWNRRNMLQLVGSLFEPSTVPQCQPRTVLQFITVQL